MARAGQPTAGLINRLQPDNQQMFVNGVAPGAIVVSMREVRDLIVRAYYISQDSDGRPGFPSLRVISLGAGPGLHGFWS